MNSRSSRSHLIFTILVTSSNPESRVETRGCLHLIDLAGCERVSKSEATGERLKEAQNINRSLSALGDVITALATKQSHVPYRNSKLTHLLADSLGGKAKVLMLCHIAPEMESLSESTSTLQWATRCSKVALGKARRNVDTKQEKNFKIAIQHKDEEIRKLKDMLKGDSNARKQRRPLSSKPSSKRTSADGKFVRRPLSAANHDKIFRQPSISASKTQTLEEPRSVSPLPIEKSPSKTHI